MKRIEHLPIIVLSLLALAAMGVLFRTLPGIRQDPFADDAPDPAPTAQEPDFQAPRAASFPASGTIEIGDAGFSAAYDEIYDNRDAYYGRSVKVSGYAAYQEGLGPGEFLIGRDLLWCCEDDMYFIGYLVRVEGSPPPEGSELLAEGVLAPMTYYNEESKKTITVPGIADARLTPIEELARRVYP